VARNGNNFIPISMAVVLHVVLLSSMMVAFDFARPAPFTPMAIQATLVTEIPETPPPVVEKQPEPEPVIEEPEPEPDNSEELRKQAEKEKRIQDAFIEKERLDKIRQQEEADRKRKEREEAQRKKDEEARQEKARQDAERKREEDIKRQRDENERLRRELEAEARQAEIDAEENRLAAVDSGELAVYKTMIRQKIERNWSAPASADVELKCSVRVQQVPGGDVIGVKILTCNGDDAVKRSVEAAVYKSSPLPEPSDPSLFDRNILLNLSIRQ
jgi:colicin import membrane protein